MPWHRNGLRNAVKTVLKYALGGAAQEPRRITGSNARLKKWLQSLVQPRGGPMSHPFGDTVTQLLHRKHGLSLSKLASGIDQPQAVVSLMCHGQRLTGPQARERVVSIIGWLHQQGSLTTQDEANTLLQAAGMAGLDEQHTDEARLLNVLGKSSTFPDERQEAPGDPSLSSPIPAGPIADPGLPPLSLVAAGLIGRDAMLAHLKARLGTGQDVGLTALNGLPGVGKTTLAVALAHDEEIRQQFPDGILWAGLGPQPNVLAHLSRWGILLGTPSIAASKLTSIEAWTPIIRAAIGERRMLLVVDDAWQIEAALAFRVGGPRCAYLVTTRFPQIAVQFAGEGVLVVREFSAEESLTLLDHLAPQAVACEPEAAQALVRASGGLPLAVTLMGKYLRKEGYAGQPRRIRAALARLRDAQARLDLSEPEPLVERSPTLALHTPHSLQSVIAISDQQLEEAAQAALRALAVFPAKPNNFSEEVALAVCQTPVEVLDTLMDVGLLESAGSGRYTLHQTIADYALTHLNDTAASARLAQFFADWVEQHEPDYNLLNLELPNIVAALDAAAASGLQESFVRCVNSCFLFVFTRGLYAQEVGRYIEQAVETARSLNQDGLLATALLNQGKVLYRQGQYAQAERCWQEARALASQVDDSQQLSEILIRLADLARFRGLYDLAQTYSQESLTLARKVSNPKLISDALSVLGSVLSDQGHFAEAEAYTQEALALARTTDDRQQITRLLLNLCSIAVLQGAYAQAETYGQEALILGREIGFLDAISAALTNLGAAAQEQQRYAQAEAYTVEALALARQLGHARIIGADLAALGNLAVRQEHYQQAADYLDEALQVARPVEDTWLLSTVLNECGELYLKQQRADDACAVFQEAFNISIGGNQDCEASALYGLARVAAARGDTAAAECQGQESLRLFEAMGNRLAGEVRAWLETLLAQTI